MERLDTQFEFLNNLSRTLSMNTNSFKSDEKSSKLILHHLIMLQRIVIFKKTVDICEVSQNLRSFTKHNFSQLD